MIWICRWRFWPQVKKNNNHFSNIIFALILFLFYNRCVNLMWFSLNFFLVRDGSAASKANRKGGGARSAGEEGHRVVCYRFLHTGFLRLPGAGPRCGDNKVQTHRRHTFGIKTQPLHFSKNHKRWLNVFVFRLQQSWMDIKEAKERASE